MESIENPGSPGQPAAGRSGAGDIRPRLLLHCCCAPCASYVLECLLPSYDITAFFNNPNIMPCEEYYKREEQMRRLLAAEPFAGLVSMEGQPYDHEAFAAIAAPYIDEPEGGLRCAACFALRLGETARRAAGGGYDCFATTLSVSPHKNAGVINETGEKMSSLYSVSYLSADFKKKNGYKRSIELSKQYGLYRQSYCGCIQQTPAAGNPQGDYPVNSVTADA